jgi:hypothetical protein
LILDVADGQRAVAGDAVGDRAGPVERRAVGDDVADQPDLVGSPAGDRLAGEQHLHRDRPRDLAGQPDRGARHREQAPLHLAHGDPRSLGRHPDVERLEDLDAAGVAVALDGGDDRRRRPEVLEEPLVDEADVGPDPLLELVGCRLARDQRADQPVEVGAGREVAAGPGQDGGPDAVVGVDHVPGVAQPAQDLGVERVLLVGTVEREGHDLTVALDQDGGLPKI